MEEPCTGCKDPKVSLYLVMKDISKETLDTNIDLYLDGLVSVLDLSEIQAEQLITIAVNKGSCYLLDGRQEYVKDIMSQLVELYKLPCKLETFFKK